MGTKRPLRALCACNSGHVRSVTLARMLGKRGFVCLTVGVEDHDDETLAWLLGWADVVFIQADAAEKLRRRTEESATLAAIPFGHKLDPRFDVGPDDWRVPEEPFLREKLRVMVEASGLRGDS